MCGPPDRVALRYLGPDHAVLYFSLTYPLTDTSVLLTLTYEIPMRYPGDTPGHAQAAASGLDAIEHQWNHDEFGFHKMCVQPTWTCLSSRSRTHLGTHHTTL